MPHSSTIAASVIALIVCGMPSPSCAADAVQRVPGASWERAAPATQGFSTRGLARAIAFAKKSGSTSGLVIHDGLIVAEWGDISSKTNLHSVRESFASALVGVAAAQGQLRLDDTLEQLGVDDEPPALSADEKQATIRMLLEARSGVYHPAAYETDGMLSEKPERHSHLPGTFWYYNNWDFNAIGAILQQASHEAFFDALKTKIADPIGMQDYAAADGHYVSGMPATRYPAYPFEMSARDLARFALLYLHGGLWGDSRGGAVRLGRRVDAAVFRQQGRRLRLPVVDECSRHRKRSSARATRVLGGRSSRPVCLRRSVAQYDRGESARSPAIG